MCRMAAHRPIDPRIHATAAGPDGDPGQGVDPDSFREALSHHAAGVTIVAVRDEGDVHATTVTSFAPVSAVPPLVVFSLGGGAQVLPFLSPGTRFVVNLLAEGQQRLASVFSDAYPVGADPFDGGGDPVIPGAVVSLICRVRSVVEAESSRLVLALVQDAVGEGHGAPLIHHRRRYRGLAAE